MLDSKLQRTETVMFTYGTKNVLTAELMLAHVSTENI